MNDSLREILRYVKLIYRRRYLFIAVSLLVMTLMVGWSYTRPEQYRAECTFFIETNVINSLVEGIAVTPDMDERIRVLRYSLFSRSLLTRVLEKLGHPVLNQGQNRIESYSKGRGERIDIDVRQNELFTVSIVDNDPHFAQDFVNMLVSTYVEESLSGSREQTYGAKRFLDEQIEHFKTKLEDSENAIIDFRKKQGVYVTVNEDAVISDVRQYKRDIETIDISLATLIAQKEQYENQLRNIPASIPLFNEQDQEARIQTLERRVRQLLLTFTDNYPEVVRLKAEIESLKSEKEGGLSNTGQSNSDMNVVNPVYQDVQQSVLNLEAEISSLQSRKNQLTKILQEREETLREMPENQKVLALLVQERDSNRRIYQELLSRHSQSEVSKQMEISDKTTTFRIVDPAFLPEIPVSPNMMQLLLLSIAAGLGAGLGTIVLLENYRKTFIQLEQLQGWDVAILATVPSLENPEQLRRTRKKDTIVFTVSSVYFLGIVSLLFFETYQRLF